MSRRRKKCVIIIVQNFLEEYCVMDSAVILALREFYEHSEMATAIISDGCRFENSRYAELFRGKAVSKDAFADRMIKKGGGYELIGDMIVGVSVVSYDGVSVIEIFDKSPVEAAMRSPGVNRYLICFFSRLRSCVHNISMISERLLEKLSDCAEKYDGIEQSFDSINSSLRDIISFILDPEQMIFLMDDDCVESVVNVSGTVKELAQQFAEYRKDIKVKTDICDSAAARFNKSSFCVLVSDITELLCSGEYIPCGIDFSVKEDENGVKVRISADNSEKHLSELAAAGEKSFSEGFFFEYISELFCKRFGASLERTGSSAYELCFPKLSDGDNIVSSAIRFDEGKQLFSPMEVRFADRRVYIPSCL